MHSEVVEAIEGYFYLAHPEVCVDALKWLRNTTTEVSTVRCVNRWLDLHNRCRQCGAELANHRCYQCEDDENE